ncbi:MAG: divalent-cation tolerance protein CutA [Planctomycetes bacterium]|nr:divalent-cation tolerance protein CutA [Planctomycetota bacterium]
MTDTNIRVVLVTAPDEEVAAALARSVVEAGLAACVNRVSGVRSVYSWEGQLHDAAEVLLVMKTTAERLDALTSKVEEEHPYDCPEVIALPVVGGAAAYLDWVRGQV